MNDIKLTAAVNVKFFACATLALILHLLPYRIFAESSWYAGGSLGYSDYDNNNIESDLADRQLPGSSSLHDDQIPWHLFVGYQHNRYLALEFGYQYLDLQKGSTVLQSQPDVTAKTSRETDGFMLSVDGLLPLSDKFTARAMAGGYLWHTVTAVNSLSGGGAIAINFDDRSIDPFVGLGIEYALTGDTAFHVQWLGLKIDDDNANVLNVGITHRFFVLTE